VGKRSHSELQNELIVVLNEQRRELSFHVYPEQRVRVSESRFRVPDICVVSGKRPREEVFTTPPSLCIEILSEDDRMSEMLTRIEDYLRFGVPTVWLIDPHQRRAWIHSAQRVDKVVDLILTAENPPLSIDLAGIWAGLDRE
jgi:Uma2 family endonuclease